LSERALRIFLAGKHELACRVFDDLRGRPSIDISMVLAQSEDAERRAALSKRARAASARVVTHGGRPRLLDAVTDLAPDLLLSLGYDRIIAEPVLVRLPRAVNVHFGMVPKYRGGFSIALGDLEWRSADRRDVARHCKLNR
jgi:methionyl-tRNA formyltransferase